MRPRAVALTRSTGFLVTLWALALPGGHAHGAEWLHGLRLEIGAEQDTNPGRLESVEGLPAPTVNGAAALRVATELDEQLVTEGRHVFGLRMAAAAKRFLEGQAQPEDLLLLDGRLGADLALGTRHGVGLSLAHYDAFQRAALLPDARDFRSTAPSARWDLRLGNARLSLGGGWRWFTFKPEAAFDFHAPTGFLVYRHLVLPPLEEGGAEWEWGASAQFEHRAFRGLACASLADCTPMSTSTARRRDDFLSVGLDATRTGAALFGAGVALMSNRSNSYGETLERLALHLRVAALLPLGLSLAGRVEGVLTRYRDRVPVGHNAVTMSFVSVEDEGRSTLRLELARPFADRYDVGLRYTLYTSLPRTSEVRFQRHTALFFLAVQFGR